jgi:hypothetical protein
MFFSDILQDYVSSVCMFQLFHVDVAKVDRMLHMLQWCSKRTLQASIGNVLSVFLHVCCKCFQMHISSVLSIYKLASGYFKSRSRCCIYCNSVLTLCPKCFIYFRHMLQRFYLNVVKVDLVFEFCSGAVTSRVL